MNRLALLILLLFIPFALVAQTRPPLAVDVSNMAVAPQDVAREGRVVKLSTGPITTDLSSTSVTFGTVLSIVSYTVPVGKVFVPASIIASSSGGPTQAYGSSTTLTKAPLGQLPLVGMVPSTMDVVFGVNGGRQESYPNYQIQSEGTIDLSIKWLGATATGRPYTSTTIMGVLLTNDQTPRAKKKILILGESTAVGSMGNDAAGVAYPQDSLWTFHIVNKLRSERKMARHVNLAMASANSTQLNNEQRGGKYDLDYDLLIYNSIKNDIAAGTSQTIYQANLKAIIDHRNTHRPDASILFVSDFPGDLYVNSNYRTWMQAVATGESFGGGTANKVYYVDASSAFALNATPASDLNFLERVVNTRLHPSGLGHGLIFRNALWPAIQQTDFYTNNKW